MCVCVCVCVCCFEVCLQTPVYLLEAVLPAQVSTACYIYVVQYYLYNIMYKHEYNSMYSRTTVSYTMYSQIPV